MTLSTLFTFSVSLCLLFSLIYGKGLVAIAVIHEHDDIWGSIIFRQASPSSPVTMQTIFEDIKIGKNQLIDYSIHEEPVHYDMYEPQVRCSEKALGPALSVAGRQIGRLSEKHRKIAAKRFGQVVHDADLSLFNNTHNSIISRSFAVKQGKGEADYRCGTIELIEEPHIAIRAGFIPCEMKEYENCLVGTSNPNLCAYKPCSGYQRYWGPVTKKTKMCTQRYEVYPQALSKNPVTTGQVKCEHGKHTLLQPIGNSWLL